MDNVSTSQQWEVNKLDNIMIKEDDPFILQNIVWKLGMIYNWQKDPTLNVNLNIVVNPFKDRKEKVYFKKNEYFLPSNTH